MKYLLSFLFVILYISGQAKITSPQKSNNSSSLPQFHFTSQKHQTGNPVGLIYCDGKYHMFYEYKSARNNGYTCLGHAVCDNLIHWKEMHETLNSKEKQNFLSMSVILDKNNKSGRQTGNVKPMIVFYTDKHYRQQMAFSPDRGETWEKKENDLHVPYNKKDSAFVSKVIWHKASGKWVMLLSRKLSDDFRGTSFYSSEDLINWKWESDFPGFQVSSDLIELNASNRPNEKIWGLFNNNGFYLLGNFDGEKFTPVTGIRRNNYGKNFYAPKFFRNIPSDDGRIIQIAGIRDSLPDGQMSFPTTLLVKKTTSGYELIQKPVKELINLQKKDYEWKNKNIIPGINQNPIRKLKGKCFRIIADFDIKTSNNFGIVVRKNKKVQGTEILYNIKQRKLSMLGVTVPFPSPKDEISFEILIDCTSIELFANDGQTVIRRKFSPVEGANSYVLFTNGGEIEIKKMHVYSLGSI